MTTEQYKNIIPVYSNEELVREYESVESLMQNTLKEKQKWTLKTQLCLDELQKRGLKSIN